MYVRRSYSRHINHPPKPSPVSTSWFLPCETSQTDYYHTDNFDSRKHTSCDLYNLHDQPTRLKGLLWQLRMLQMSTHCIRETGFGAGEKLGPYEKR